MQVETYILWCLQSFKTQNYITLYTDAPSPQENGDRDYPIFSEWKRGGRGSLHRLNCLWFILNGLILQMSALIFLKYIST